MPSVPDPANVKPWYLRNITEALALDDATGNVYVRTGFTGNIVIAGNVNIPGNVQVFSSPEDPVHTHISEVGTSNILNVPFLPIGGNVIVSSGNIDANVHGNVGILTMPNVNASITGTVIVNSGNIDANVHGNVGILGNVNVTQATSPWIVSGNVIVTSIPEVEIKNDTGNAIPISKNTTINSESNPIIVQGTSDMSFFSPVQSDAFGRLRVSNPTTLFDSFHRFQDNGLIGTYTANGGTCTYTASSAVVNMNVTTTSGSACYRESTKNFAYQPGKSLLVLQTFVLAPHQTNLRQRVGYFDTQNGFYFQVNDSGPAFVRRSYSSGSIVDTVKTRNEWDDPLDGTGPSGVDLDFSKAQILWHDIEWLGVGTARCGFVYNGEFVIAYKWNHANIVSTTYMTTACLPVRAEIEATGVLSTSASTKIICTSVISEGGYEVRGRPRNIGHDLASPRIISSGTLYPVMSVRLKSSRLSAIVVPRTFSVGVTGNNNYRWRIVTAGTTTGGSWIDPGSDTSLEYNLTATSISGGTIVETGYIINSNQSSISPNMADTPFLWQLTKNSFTSTAYEFTICIETTGTNNDCWAAINWEDIT